MGLKTGRGERKEEKEERNIQMNSCGSIGYIKNESITGHYVTIATGIKGVARCLNLSSSVRIRVDFAGVVFKKPPF